MAVVGTNSSGKSALGIELARRVGGEVVSADSRQVYRGLDLGTGKVTSAEMAGVPHHLLDVVDPGEPFSLAAYQRLAYAAIDALVERAVTPLLVGGSGLYARAVVEGYQLVDAEPDPARRAELQSWNDERLLAELERLDPTAAEQLDLPNRRRLVRAVEIAEAGHVRADTRRRQPRYRTLLLGLTWPRPVLDERIATRLRARMDAGLVAEVEGLLAAGVEADFLEGLGLEYRFTIRYLRGEYASEDELFEHANRAVCRFARRQLSWFRRDEEIVWLDCDGDYVEQAAGLVERFLR
ncbi:MAG TPA: tRNA (adenosine(37)-N6)-dimethylallyltransferase MiaA [Thermoleophilaceae bacterium]